VLEHGLGGGPRPSPAPRTLLPSSSRSGHRPHSPPRRPRLGLNPPLGSVTTKESSASIRANDCSRRRCSGRRTRPCRRSAHGSSLNRIYPPQSTATDAASRWGERPSGARHRARRQRECLSASGGRATRPASRAKRHARSRSSCRRTQTSPASTSTRHRRSLLRGLSRPTRQARPRRDP